MLLLTNKGKKKGGEKKGPCLLSSVQYISGSAQAVGGDWLCHGTLFLVYLLPVVTIIYVFLLGFYLKNAMVFI